jgi:RNA polymerase subunit RPABC4/transcription elongation factor Spt4
VSSTGDEPPVPPPVPPGGYVPPVSTRSCPKCQSIVDLNATFCPVCGLNLRSSDGVGHRSNAWLIVVIIAAVLIGGGLAIGLASGGSTRTETTVVTTPAKSSPPVSVTVSAPTKTVTAPIQTVIETTTEPAADTPGGGSTSP